MAEYKVAAVSQQPPKDWAFTDKKTGLQVHMETYKVKIEGDDEPIDVNRKPGQIPTVGELLVGTIEASDFGRRFKAAPKAFTPGQNRDQESIKAQWAIGQAVALGNKDLADIETVAGDLFLMIDRVKAKAPAPGFDKAKQIAENIKNKQTFSDGSPVDDYKVTGDELVNLDDIPF